MKGWEGGREMTGRKRRSRVVKEQRRRKEGREVGGGERGWR
jgi:hypothetical protein